MTESPIISPSLRMGRNSRIGYIERVSSNRRQIGGWLNSDDATTTSLRLHVGAEPYGAPLRIGGPRADLPPAGRTFVVDLQFPLPKSALFEGDLSLGSPSRRLGISKGLYMREVQNLQNHLAALNGGTLLAPVSGLGEMSTPESVGVSLVPFPTGTPSADGSAFIGPGGQMFLKTGSNRIIDHYSNPKSFEEREHLDSIIHSWSEVITNRRDYLGNQGIDFLQLIQPEKSSVLDTGHPAMRGLTPGLRLLEERLRNNPNYVSGSSALDEALCRSGLSKNDLGLQLDSHLAAPAMHAFATALLTRLKSDFDLSYITWRGATSYTGDLTERFFGVPIASTTIAPASSTQGVISQEPILVSQRAAYSGHSQIGRQGHWINPEAPVNHKVLLFGSSSASRNCDSPHKLTYWLSRIFREYKFVWTPYIDYDIVREFQPSVVIHQTVERFMRRVPEDRGR